ncbi:hydroxypyruvate isomerase family protein [Paenibacillaceae bacterium WGS1546]|uniref:hydroxypyruvate isomerase family protein n=1 Tax=Cohnella sp. WGS1546 TaxID=3366810 RepID=UPI00372CE78F
MDEQLRTVKEAGYSHFEMWSWWDKDLDAVEAAMRRYGLRATTMCTKFVTLTEDGKRDEYLAGLQESIAAARRLGVEMLITQTGNETDAAREKQYASLIGGLRACIPYLEESGITLVVEPLNHLVDHPGYYLTSSDEAAQIIKEVGHPQVKMLFDIYHQQITEGHLAYRLQTYLPYIGHIHIADNPGRNEPGTGEINYRYLLELLKKRGYGGAVGLEYFPVKSVKESLGELMNSYESLLYEKEQSR